MCRSVVFRSDESTTAPCSIPNPQTSSTYSYVTCVVLVLGWLTSVSRLNSVEVSSKSAGHASLAATCRSTSQAVLHVLAAVMRACFLEPPRVLKRSYGNAQYHEEIGRYSLRSDNLPALDGHGSSPKNICVFLQRTFCLSPPAEYDGTLEVTDFRPRGGRIIMANMSNCQSNLGQRSSLKLQGP